ncbi:MAG: hypothetical protein ACPG5B_00580 [Chitinophagales bacterium]
MKQISSTFRLLALFTLCIGTLFFSSCEDTGTNSPCNITLTSLNFSSSSFSSGADITGTVNISTTTTLSDITIKNMVNLYLSTDGTYSSDDTFLTAFRDDPSDSGSQYSVFFNQIEIPFGLEDGSYHIVAYSPAQACSTGGNTNAAQRSKQITIN